MSPMVKVECFLKEKSVFSCFYEKNNKRCLYKYVLSHNVFRVCRGECEGSIAIL